ncbi:MAG: GAF domain-containing protein, partial [Syntrophales bacterium]|nr:GAF domain-containing protein [Syntrophales bacterium]
MDEKPERGAEIELGESEETSFRSYATYVAGRLLDSCFNLQDLANITTDMFVELMRVDLGCLMLFREKSEGLSIAVVKGIKQEGVRSESAIETNRDVVAWIVEWKKPIILSELSEQPVKDFFRMVAEKMGMTITVSIPLVAKGGFIGLINLGEKESKMPFYRKDIRLLSTLSVLVTMAMRNAKLYDNLFKSYLSTVSALAEAIETKDPYTRGHSDRVSRYACAIGRAMEISEHGIESIRIAGILHDI